MNQLIKSSIVFAALLSLASCGGGSSSISSSISSSASSTSSSQSSSKAFECKWVTPTGAPTLAFYDQGSNANWVSASNPSEVVVPAFASNSYDAIVFDGVSGLNVLTKNPTYNYKLASWISGGNFYVVSVKHAAGEAFAGTETIDGFVKTGNAARSFVKLAADVWNWAYEEANVTWESGVADVKTHLVSNPEGFDYYIVAEPVLTAAKSALANAGKTLNVIYNLQEEWTKAYNQPTIPAAALFVNTVSYAANKVGLDAFISETQTRQDKAVDEIATVKAALDAYGDDTAVTKRFGYTSALANALQSNGNKFGILKSGVIADKKAFANDFNAKFGSSSFSEDLFL